MLTVEFLRDRFEYKDGSLYYKHDSGRTVKAGTRAGTITKSGYGQISINKKFYRLHRLVFLMFNGYLPKFVDHIDGNPFNNRIENLRECTHQENLCNQKRNTANTSGYKNVMWNPKFNKWRVALTVKKRNIHIGHFEDLEFAVFAAEEARNKFHGKFARTE